MYHYGGWTWKWTRKIDPAKFSDIKELSLIFKIVVKIYLTKSAILTILLLIFFEAG